MAIKIPVEITLRDIEHSAAIEARIREKIPKLEQVVDTIISCHVVVEQAQKRQNKGKLYSVMLNLQIPNDKIAINKVQHEDVYVAIRNAFDAARRKLLDTRDKQRGHIKTHDMTHQGHIVRLFTNEGYGFIESDGVEYYFSNTNVSHPSFDQLSVGAEVHFIEVMAAEGPQANRVTAKS